MRFLSVNENAFLIELDALETTIAVYQSLNQANHPYIQELIPAARTVLVYFDPIWIDKLSLIKWIRSQKIELKRFNSTKEIVIGVHYDGCDLAEIADHLGLTTQQLIRKHTESCWQVAFIGFAPGFAYLMSHDQPFGSVPRRSSPRKKVTAGSVGLAGEYSGIYPKESPGGWQLIGRTDEIMWDIHRENPALLLPSDQVIFKDISRNPTQTSVSTTLVHSNLATHKPVLFEVLNTGLQVLVQDQGRHHVASLGVGRAGALDQSSFAEANLIVGNPKHAAVLEILNGGLKLKVIQPSVIAVTGALSELWITYKETGKRQASLCQPIALDEGDEIYLTQPKEGLRNYLAVQGGIYAEQVLGSVSYDSLAELGTSPIQVGDQIYSAQLKTYPVELNHFVRTKPKVGDEIIIDVCLGPRTDWFSTDSLELFFNQRWQVSAESNRIGLRLSGEKPLVREIDKELPSEGCCTGAIQVPPNGQPVLFMNDHPITGGYPVISSVAAYHLDLIAQIPTGCLIKFRQISDFMDLK